MVNTTCYNCIMLKTDIFLSKMSDKFGLILLTGQPGVGKTTLVQKVAEELKGNHKIDCYGFYTKEVRDPVTRERTGFDVVSFDQKTVPLARSGVKIKGPYVGKYGVYVKDFEELVLPILKPSHQQLLIIDEIGKMELKSKLFELAVSNCLNRTTILATIPHDMRQPLTLVEQLKQQPHARVFVINRTNRDSVHAIVVENIVKIMKHP